MVVLADVACGAHVEAFFSFSSLFPLPPSLFPTPPSALPAPEALLPWLRPTPPDAPPTAELRAGGFSCHGRAPRRRLLFSRSRPARDARRDGEAGRPMRTTRKRRPWQRRGSRRFRVRAVVSLPLPHTYFSATASLTAPSFLASAPPSLRPALSSFFMGAACTGGFEWRRSSNEGE